MTQAFLYMRNKSTTNSQVAVFKEINMQLVQVGADFGVDEDSSTLSPQFNRVIHWGNDLLAVNENNIYRYDVAANTGVWELFHALGSPGTTLTTHRAGLTPCSIDGSGVLVTSYAINFNQGRHVLIDKELNVQEITYTNNLNDWTSTVGGAGMWAGQAIPYRNSIIGTFKANSTAIKRTMQYDLKTNTNTFIQPAGGVDDTRVGQMCVFNDQVYICAQQNNGFLELWKIVGTNWTFLGNIEPTTVGPNTAIDVEGGGALVESNGKLYAINCNSGNTAWRCYELTIDSNGNLVSSIDVSSIVIPASLTSKTTGESSFGVMRVDGITNGPTNPIYEFLVYVSNTEGQSVDLYRWENHPSGVMTFVDAGMDARRFTSINTNGGTGGGRIWSGSGTLNVAQPCLSLNLNGLDIDAEFTLYGPTPSLSGVSLELYFDKEGEVAKTRGTISSTTSGVLVGNQITGLTADNVTKLTVGWAAVTDGIISGDNPLLAARVFIP